MTNNIICHNLLLGFGHKALTKPLDITIKTNQWVGIVGENGIGKSTFFKTILGILPPVGGEITVMGKSPKKANRQISYIPQEREINVMDNTTALTLIKASYKGSAWGWPHFGKNFTKTLYNLLEIVGARHYVNQPFHTLSGGQKKRIYLVQALINQPKLILLDEPLSDLDPQAKHDFINVLRYIHRKKNLTLLIISHDMHEIAHELDTFIHFKNQQVHFCHELPCLREDADVNL
ncbi:metal ABC transporter ATP-binding protein [Facilibium subflavum]|uniref:metal ABC transporter ATP-binding protein n=1 Tax=Facilibium subflavum TaxID=2219058 RepID=UPI000E65A6EB|nr:ATP-binding cassette domain-containing protein [Facilibium subflavum]